MAMNIRPAPVHRVTGDAGSGRRLAALVPVLALVLVVSAAWAGTWLHGRPAGDGAATADPAVGGPPDDAGSPRASMGPGGIFPAHARDLLVLSGDGLRAGRAAGTIRRELVAVAGILRSEPLPLSCPAVQLTLARTFCHRLVALFPVPGTSGGPSSASTIEGHLLPGTDVPPALRVESELASWTTRAVPVVLIGHFEDQRAPSCEGIRDWCRDDLVVEQVAWVSGAWLEPPIVRDPEIPGPDAPVVLTERAQANLRRAASRGETVLGQAVLRNELLAVVDPVAYRAAVAVRHPWVWYVRSITAVQPGRPPHVTWAVIDETTGLVLGYSLIAP